MVFKTTADDLRKVTLLPLAMTLIILLGSAIWGVTYVTQRNLEFELENRLTRFDHQFQRKVEYETKALDLGLDFVQAAPDLQQAWLSRDRELLLAKVTPLFKHLQSDHELSHLYFVDTDQACFLRAHNPRHYGDKITRYTMNQAVATESESGGLELGKRGAFTLRMVRPWYLDGQLVGYVELGKEVRHITDGIQQALGVELTSLLHKSCVAEADWKAGQSVFQFTGNWNEFEEHVTLTGTTSGLPPEIYQEFNGHEHGRSENDRSLFKVNGRTTAIGSRSMVDVAGEEVGHYLLQWDVTEATAAREKTVYSMVISMVMIGGLLLVFFWYYLGRIQARMKTGQTELHTARNQAEQSSLAKSEFLANMSHEIRTPMNGLVGMVDLLLESELQPSQQEYAELAQTSALSLLKLINDILDFSKIEAGKLDIEHTAFDIHDKITKFGKFISVSVATKNLEFVQEIDDQVPHFVMGDPSRLHQILTNLVGNAVKFTPTGQVRLGVTVIDEDLPSPMLRFSVTDTGIGIHPHKQAKLFEAFTQADGSTTRKFGGTGLGLTISRQLTTLMNGEIGVNSAPGEGSEFWFTIPLETAEQGEGRPEPANEPEVKTFFSVDAADQPRILLVEDNFVNQKIALGILKNIDVSVDTAINGLEAIQALTEHRYDLVLMDCQMPEMDGYEATGIIRSESSTVLDHQVPVIAMTANAMEGDREKCLAAGMNDYLAKPVRPQTLRATLNQWLSQQPVG